MSMNTTYAERRWGYRNLLVCTVVGLPVLGLCSLAVSTLLRIPLVNALVIAAFGMWCVALLVLLGTWLRNRSVSGAVLLDCGSLLTGYGHWFFVGLLLLLAARIFAADTVATIEILGTLSYLMAAGLLAVLALSRKQVRENGIWSCGSLLRWQRIISWEWDSESEATLLIQFKARFPLHGTMVLTVPVERKAAFDELLRTYCPPGT